MDMSETRRRQPKYRHVAPAVALMVSVVVVMAGITISRLSAIPADNPVAAQPAPAVRVRLVGLPRAEAAGAAAVRDTTSSDAAARVTAAAEVSAAPASVAEPEPVPVAVVDGAPVAAVEAEAPTLPLSPGTLMVGLAAARSRTLASASPRPAPPAECKSPVVQNFDADIVGMTGVPGRKMYYGRTKKNGASPCGRGEHTASATP
jgi:hypothetical protein